MKRAKCLETHKTQFVETAEKINLLKMDINSEYKIDLNYISAFDDMYGVIKYYEAKHGAPTTEAQNSTTINVTPPPNQPAGFQIKLQPLDLPSFSGNLADWPLFIEMFKNNVHNRTDLPKSVKMQYLMSKLTDRALSVTAGVPPTEDNYDIIYKALTDKYDDKRGLASHYMDTLFSYKPLRGESGFHLGNFVDKYGATVAALNALDMDVGEFMLFYLANSKLDEETRRAFETSLQEEMPTFKKLLEFLTNRTKMLSRVNPGSWGNQIKGDHVNINKPYKKQAAHSFLVNKVNVSSGSSSSSSKNNNFKDCSTNIYCTLCHKDHFITKCEKFLALLPRDRFIIVKQHALCVNCLCPNHRAYECNKRIQCSVCKLKHNSLLHFQSKQVEMEPPSPEGSDNTKVCACAPVTPVLTDNNAAETTVLLSTVKVLVKGQKAEIHPLRL